jgi:nucleoid DNA-binding protein
VTKAEIIDQVAHGTGLTKIETEAVVNGFITLVMNAVIEGDSVELRGFGSFRPKHRAARVARNPKTKEKIDIPERFVPHFKPARDFRDAVESALASEL